MRLPKSLAARIGAVAATAAIAVTGATAAASASTAAPVTKIPTALSIKNTTPVAYRPLTTSVINGQLTAGKYDLRHLRVWLQRKSASGHWYVIQTKLTRRHGHVFFRVFIGRKAVSFRLVFRGTRNFARSVSAVDTIAPATSA
ncbi:MAG TPA: hypothetical protein VGH96_21035 [Streptosporangiaceae bacterium]|jgi:hypothetical protein